jgi:hypothetical protein
MNNIVEEEFYPKIMVYKNLLTDPKKATDILKRAEEDPSKSLFNGWSDWYTFGKNCDMFDISYARAGDIHAITAKKLETKQHQEEYDFFKEVILAFSKSTDLYMEKYNVEKPENWFYMGPSFCKYEINAGITEDLAMHYHSDYQLEHVERPGHKFAITCTMYFNDDYEDGGVDFLVNNKLIYYKPVAGDVMVFPAGNPDILTENGERYYHGVKKCKKNPKYFVRVNWVYEYPGSEKWHQGIEKYGEQLWLEMDEERRTAERKTGMYHIEPNSETVRIK